MLNNIHQPIVMDKILYVISFLAASCIVHAVSAQGMITFPAHVGYRAERWAYSAGNRIRVCPLPTQVSECLAGRGWVDPDVDTPIRGYWLRHTIIRKDGAAVLYFCKDGKTCDGDNQRPPIGHR